MLQDLQIVAHYLTQHTNLAKDVIHKLQEDLVHVEIILGTRFAEAHSTYSRAKLQHKHRINLDLTNLADLKGIL